MNSSTIKILIDSYPTVYRVDTAFFINNGWSALLFDLGAFIAARTKHCKVSEVKEKFGLMRVYTDFDLNEEYATLDSEQIITDIYNYIAGLEKRSYNMCMDCGEQVTIKATRIWEPRLCNQCKNKPYTDQ